MKTFFEKASSKDQIGSSFSSENSERRSTGRWNRRRKKKILWRVHEFQGKQEAKKLRLDLICIFFIGGNLILTSSVSHGVYRREKLYTSAREFKLRSGSAVRFKLLIAPSVPTRAAVGGRAILVIRMPHAGP